MLGAGGCRALSRALAASPPAPSAAPAQLNASDDRGIDVVREQIKSFAGTRKLFSTGVKLIVLDEADNMTHDAQFALRRVIEKYTRNTRFCLICNYVSKIIPALQSRCTRFRFAPLNRGDMEARMASAGGRAAPRFAPRPRARARAPPASVPHPLSPSPLARRPRWWVTCAAWVARRRR